MAKLVKTYEKNIEKTELTYRGEVFDVSMLPTDSGWKGDKKSLDTQFEERFPNIDEDVLEIVSQIDCEESMVEILELLEQLTELEAE